MDKSQEERSGPPEEFPAAATATEPGRGQLVLAGAVAAGLVLVLTLAPLAWLVSGLDARPVEVVSAASTLGGAPQGPGPRVRTLPTDAAGGAVARPDDLLVTARIALGGNAAERLIAVLTSPDSVAETAMGGSTGYAPYPYRYPALEQLLDAAPEHGRTEAVARLGADLIRLSAVERQRDQISNAGPAAFALLYRARASGGCASELNLLLLLAADDQPRDELVERQATLAVRACPGDPTPGWLLGQFEAQRAILNPFVDAPGDHPPHDRMQRAPATFATLTEQFPTATDAWAGSGDAHLRIALQLTESQPFTARAGYRDALSAYQHAAALRGGDDAVAGEARALIGLGEPDRAATLVRQLLPRAEHPGPLLELLLLAEESAHGFRTAVGTAQRLAQLGPSAFPKPVDLYPDQTPYYLKPNGTDLNGPLSSRIGRLSPYEVQLQPGPGGASADVTDGSFIPIYRDDAGFVGSFPNCPGWAWRRDAILAHLGSSALSAVSEATDVRPVAHGNACGPPTSQIGGIFAVASGTPQSGATSEERSQAWDRLQNMWRWAGDLETAADVVRQWDRSTLGQQYLPALRDGEIHYLQGHFDAAAAAFGGAARRAADGYLANLSVDEARLDRAAALLAGNRRDEARLILREIDSHGTSLAAYFQHTSNASDAWQFATRWARVSYYSRLQLGDSERLSGELAAASEDYAAALELTPLLDNATGLRPEVVQNNLAIVDLAAGRDIAAEQHARTALMSDKANPALLMTAAYIAERSGRTREASARNRAALVSDPGAFPAANDLGIELADDGDHSGAVAALRQAVRVRPDYALGWFNLGVLHSQGGNLLASQGAYARAFALDPSLQDTARRLTIDSATYRTGLDLSRPLPPAWSFSDLQRRTPASAAGLLTVLLLALAMAKAVPHGGQSAQEWLELITGRVQRLPGLRRLTHPGWAVAATVVAFLLPLVWSRGAGLTETIAFVLGLLALIGALMLVRFLAARRTAAPVTHETWTPGLVFGLATGAIGAPWAPLPTLGHTEDTPRVHYAGPILLAVAAAVLLVQAAILPVPLSHRLGIAALIMAGSLLLPLRPMDGARLGSSGKIAGVGVIGAALLVALGLI